MSSLSSPSDLDRYTKLHTDGISQELYKATQVNQQLLCQNEYHLIIMWGSDWDSKVKVNDDLERLVSSYEEMDPVNPRMPSFGEILMTRFHDEANETECVEIKYVEVTSFYPWVNGHNSIP